MPRKRKLDEVLQEISTANSQDDLIFPPVEEIIEAREAYAISKVIKPKRYKTLNYENLTSAPDAQRMLFDAFKAHKSLEKLYLPIYKSSSTSQMPLERMRYELPEEVEEYNEERDLNLMAYNAFYEWNGEKIAYMYDAQLKQNIQIQSHILPSEIMDNIKSFLIGPKKAARFE